MGLGVDSICRALDWIANASRESVRLERIAKVSRLGKLVLEGIGPGVLDLDPFGSSWQMVWLALYCSLHACVFRKPSKELLSIRSHFQSRRITEPAATLHQETRTMIDNLLL